MSPVVLSVFLFILFLIFSFFRNKNVPFCLSHTQHRRTRTHIIQLSHFGKSLFIPSPPSNPPPPQRQCLPTSSYWNNSTAYSFLDFFLPFTWPFSRVVHVSGLRLGMKDGRSLSLWSHWPRVTRHPSLACGSGPGHPGTTITFPKPNLTLTRLFGQSLKVYFYPVLDRLQEPPVRRRHRVLLSDFAPSHLHPFGQPSDNIGSTHSHHRTWWYHTKLPTHPSYKSNRLTPYTHPLSYPLNVLWPDT